MRLGSYELVRQIGAGGMGEVWVAHRRGPGSAREPVAIKRLPRRLAGDPNYRRILLDEARLSSLLDHPNIIRTLEAGEADGEVFIAMELIDGLDLARVTKLLAQLGERLPVELAAYVIAELLRGLSFAHDLEHEGELISLVHRDVSPHNVMLSTSGSVKLADFGIARLSSEDTSGTHVKGKARYMPPEQLRGDSRSPTVDLFAVGAVLQELLDGSVFRGDAVDDARLLGMAIDGEVPPPRHPHEIPAALEQLRARLLDPDPKRRPATARHALELLRRWPSYRPCTGEIAALVQRLRQHEAELGSGHTQSGLAHQATFLHTNEFELDDSQLHELASAVEAPDQILLALAGDASESATRIPINQHTADTLGTRPELDRTDGGPSATGGGPSATGGGPAATGGSREPPRDPSLALDLSGESFARHVPTSPNPIVPASRRVWPLALGLVALLVAGLGLGHALDLLPRGSDPSPTIESTLRNARVVGRGSLLDLGLRDPGMHRLLERDILFDYRPDPDVDPLAVLALGEAELALVRLDDFLAAGSPGTVVATLGASLGAEALILDSQDHDGLRSLAALESPVTIACTQSTVALARRLDATLAVELEVTLLPDDAAVVAELERDDSPIVAGIVREPWIGKALAAGMSVGVSGLDVPHAGLEVLVARAELDSALIEAVLATYDAALLARRAERQSAILDRAAAAYGLSVAEAERVLARVCLFAEAGTTRESAEVQLSSCLDVGDATPQPELSLGSLPDLAGSPFEPESATLSVIGAELIEQLGAELRAFNPRTVSAEILGFGERTGPAGRKLGSARARQLIAALRTAGVSMELRESGADARDAPPSRVRVVVSGTDRIQ